MIRASRHAKQQTETLTKAIEYALTLAHRAGVEAQVSASKTIGIKVSTRFTCVENVLFNNFGQLNITVHQQQRTGSASSTDLSKDAIERAMQAALGIAQYTSADPCAGLPEKELLAWHAPALDLFYPMEEMNVEVAIQMAALAEDCALQADKRITRTEGGHFTSHYAVSALGNTQGFLQHYCTSRHSLSTVVIAEQNGQMERDYAWTTSRQLANLQSAEWVGQECAKRVLARLNPQKIITQQTPVLFSAEVASELLGHLVAAISGGSLYRRSSFLLDHLGKSIMPEWLSIQERPHIPLGLASAPFDAEGVQTQNRTIVESGVLETYLLSSYSARKLNMQTTGHAGGIYNWFVSDSGQDFQGILKELDRGLLVTELMGQGVNLVTGDYSQGACGFWVEQGEIQYPVNEITIAGNLKDMFANIKSIADDRDTRLQIQCGSMLLPALQIAGN